MAYSTMHFTTIPIPDNAVNKHAPSLLPYISHLNSVAEKNTYDADESSINLPADKKLLENVKNMTEKVTKNKKPRYILDIGIGGSNLGTKAIYDALYGFFDVIEPNRFPKIIFLDTNDSIFISKLLTFLGKISDPDDVVINAISKSGGTTETIANLEFVMDALREKNPNITDRLVLTTDEGSKLWKHAEQENIHHLPLPTKVGGRYSVLSAVGLFPLYLCCIDVERLQQGALDMRGTCLTDKIDDNPAAQSALTLYHQLGEGKNIHDTFLFAPQLESLGKWYRQLMGESIGKEHNRDGEVVNAGITPTVSIGSTDLHSVGQLYLGGPKDKVTTFVSAEKTDESVTLPQNMQFSLVENLEGKSAAEIMCAIREGVKAAYQKQNLPFMEVTLERVSEYELGQFLQMKMIEIMYLGKLLNVNTFDQPHVELYKVETKKILSFC